MFFDRLREACEMRNTAPTTVVRAVACSTGMMDGWKKGSYPRSDVVVKLADYLNVSADYLLERTDNPAQLTKNMRILEDEECRLIDGLRSVEHKERELILKMTSAALATTPGYTEKAPIRHFSRLKGDMIHRNKSGYTKKDVMGRAAAGPPITAVPEKDRSIQIMAKYKGNRYFIVQAAGDSMINAGIDDGDFCVFDRDAYRDDGDIMLVQIDGVTDQPDVAIKRVYLHNGVEPDGEDTTVELRSANPAYKNMLYPAREVNISGVLVDIVKPQ